VIGSEHECRRKFLHALAVLTGFEPQPYIGLPDGSIPDVLLVQRSTRGLFIGDAKETETPGTGDTQARLIRYMHWFGVHLEHPLSWGMFAICCGGDVEAWLRVLNFLACESGLHELQYGGDCFGGGFHVACCYRAIGGLRRRGSQPFFRGF
jgi:hypothetical protein